MKAIRLLLLGTLLLSCGSAGAVDANLTLQQLNHRVFTPAEGAPTDIYALAQTSDGTLWIGSTVGLIRFDGIRFVAYPGPSEQPLLATNIASLFAAPNGGLWIGFRPTGVALLKDGHVTRYDDGDGLPEGTVAQFAQDRDGSVWAATRTGLAHLRDKRWEKVGDESALSSPY